MDVGDATFTSFEASEDWVAAFEQFPQIDPTSRDPNWFIGKIHSHHNMGAYHSGTDTGDLESTAPNMSMFLSLVVNYRGDTDCKLAIAYEIEETVLKRVKWKLKGWLQSETKNEVTKSKPKKIYVIKCKVDYEQDAWFADQTEKILDAETASQTASRVANSYQAAIGNGALGSDKEDDEMIARWIQKLASDKIADLILFGNAGTMTPHMAITTASRDVSASESKDYVKAFQVYYHNTWFPWVFGKTVATPIDGIKAVRIFTKNHGYQWIQPYITKALNELENGYKKLREV